MSARTIRNMTFIAGILALIVVFGFTGQAKQNLERQRNNKGFFESIGSELSGRSAAEVNDINALAHYNRLLLGGAVVCFIIGTAAWFSIDD